MVVYGYMRVSTRDKQSTDRQKKSLMDYGVPEQNIYEDKMTGKTMYRKEYQKMKKKLVEGDTLVVHEVDRFSRDYEGGKRELIELQSSGVTVIFLDKLYLAEMTRSNNDDNAITKAFLDGQMLFALAVSHEERKRISKRTKESLAIKKEQGVKLGRPKGTTIPKGFESVLAMVNRKEITNEEAAEMLKISRTQLFKLKKEHSREIANG